MSKVYDVIIVGTGIAGIFTALNIDRKLNVLLITKSSIENANSSLAQGGIVSCINPNIHFEDTMRAGSFCNNEKAIKIIEEGSMSNIEKLIEYGVDFDRDENGDLKLTREGGHSENTILYSKDVTGKEIIRALNEQVCVRDNIDILENTLVIELLKANDKIKGIVCLDANGRKNKFLTKALVLATGGIGRVYENTTNAEIITGDGIALAHKIGASTCDMEFIQFHPTALYGDDYEKRFLISEALRGEGGILRNINDESFMMRYHTMGDLAPRDVVARSIFNEMKLCKSDFVYLDMTHKDSIFIKDRFPNIYEHCLSKGTDITTDYIRVSPAEHYIMGGIKTDLHGSTNIDGLYACGECACTGVHGANRLASNSLLEGIVFGERVAKSIVEKYLCSEEAFDDMKTENTLVDLNDDSYEERDIDYERSFIILENKLRETMSLNASIIRSKSSLISALEKISELEDILKDYEILNKKYFELENMLIVSRLIVEGALERTESIGSHFIVKDDGSEVSC